jgi:hypothetical protein
MPVGVHSVAWCRGFPSVDAVSILQSAVLSRNCATQVLRLIPIEYQRSASIVEEHLTVSRSSGDRGQRVRSAAEGIATDVQRRRIAAANVSAMT